MTTSDQPRPPREPRRPPCAVPCHLSGAGIVPVGRAAATSDRATTGGRTATALRTATGSRTGTAGRAATGGRTAAGDRVAKGGARGYAYGTAGGTEHGTTPRETDQGPVSGAIHSWDLSTGVDGPGTRFVVFTSGCPLRCLYCHNPDTWQMRNGRRVTVDEVMAELGKYERFISVAGGGFTVSGGEPLLQPAFTAEMLRRAHGLGLHTALDTSGFLGDRATDEMLADTDLVLLDIKSWDPKTYLELTGVDVEPTLRFARRLADLGRKTWVRFVVVPGVTDAEDNVAGIAEFVAGLPNVRGVDILPFHRLGAPKYERLGIPFRLADVEPPDQALLERIHSRFRAAGVRTH